MDSQNWMQDRTLFFFLCTSMRTLQFQFWNICRWTTAALLIILLIQHKNIIAKELWSLIWKWHHLSRLQYCYYPIKFKSILFVRCRIMCRVSGSHHSFLVPYQVSIKLLKYKYFKRYLAFTPRVAIKKWKCSQESKIFVEHASYQSNNFTVSIFHMDVANLTINHHRQKIKK